MGIEFNSAGFEGFIKQSEYDAIAPLLGTAHKQVLNKNGAGSDFLGWTELPAIRDKAEHAKVKEAAKSIKNSAEVLVVIGIGGSYLGARSAIEFLHSPNYNSFAKDTPKIYFAGNTISPEALEQTLLLCEGKEVAVNVISKSGTTTEPAIAFRVFKNFLEERYGKEKAKERIYVTTDSARGALRKLAEEEGYKSFVVPDDVGGRYSVLTPVGLLPIACSGADIDAVMEGAAQGAHKFTKLSLDDNDCYRYAAARNILYKRGKTTEILSAFEPCALYFAEWWKQLFGESEGKDGKGLFPASVIFSTDLHSMGQYIQDGMRNIFETVLKFDKPSGGIKIPAGDPADGLGYLEGQSVDFVNQKALAGTLLAHRGGGVPCGVIEISDRSERTYGELVYFFMQACAVSGYINGVNPFDQPGVEDYKNNMYALLGKPGYEKLRMELEAKI